MPSEQLNSNPDHPSELNVLMRLRLWLQQPIVKVGFSVVVVLIISYLVWDEMHQLSWHDVRSAAKQASSAGLLAALGFTLLALATMGCYDLIAFPSGVKQVSGMTRWLVGVFAFSWSNLVSVGGLAGPAFRYFAYRRIGLSDGEVAQGLSTHYVANIFGLIAWLIAALIPFTDMSDTTLFIARAAIALALCLAFGFVLAYAAPNLNRLIKRLTPNAEFSDLRRRLPLLGVVSFLEWTFTYLAFACIAQAIVGDAHIGKLAATYFPGIFAGLLSLLPAGAGVADAIWVHIMSAEYLLQDSVAIALLYRMVYYILPWLCAAVCGYIYLARTTTEVHQFHRRFIAVVVATGATLLLLSSATPPVASRFEWLSQQLPIPLVETSHLISIVLAVILLHMVRGLWHGYRSAMIAVSAMLGISVVSHFLKGVDFEESLLSLILLAMLGLSSGTFARRGRLGPALEVTGLLFITTSFLFIFVGVASTEKLGWVESLTQIGPMADSSRFFRGLTTIFAVGALFFIRTLTTHGEDKVYASDAEMTRAEQLIRSWASNADALLIGGGDKAVWFWPVEGRDGGLVIYQVVGMSLVVYKDPVIDPNLDRRDLIRDLIKLADERDLEPVFAMLSWTWMDTLHDFGFRFVKFTQEAYIPLDTFSLQGKDNAYKRRALNYCERNGVTFKVEHAPHSSALISACREISDAWLKVKGGAEMQFSACYFSAAYLQRNPLAVAYKDGKAIAFLNLLLTRPGGPTTFDFMRYKPEIVNGLMDYLIIQTAIFCRTQGYASLSLGGAALSNVGKESTARWLERAMHEVFERAERVYNYEGLYQYKSKFDPDWEPRYIAYRLRQSWLKALYACYSAARPSRAERKRIAAMRISA